MNREREHKMTTQGEVLKVARGMFADAELHQGHSLHTMNALLLDLPHWQPITSAELDEVKKPDWSLTDIPFAPIYASAFLGMQLSVYYPEAAVRRAYLSSICEKGSTCVDSLPLLSPSREENREIYEKAAEAWIVFCEWNVE